MNKQWKSLIVVFFVATLLAGCGSTPSDEQKQVATNQVEEEDFADERDPIEGFNRKMWYFNWEILDKYMLRPVAVGYKNYVPDPAQTGVRNFVTNLEEPGYAVNSLLQGKVKKSGNAAGRFLLNTTVGVLGLIDVAQYVGLKQQQETFDETLAVYGVGNGPYIMLPGLGPSTAREFTGDLVDSQIFPMQLIGWPWNFVTMGVKAVYTRADLIQTEGLINSSFDSYSFIKEAYYQNQTYQIYDGNPPIEEEEEFDEDFFDDEF